MMRITYRASALLLPLLASCGGGADPGDSRGGCTNADADAFCLEHGDCDDTRADVNPGVVEEGAALCADGLNNDCDTGADAHDAACSSAPADTGPVDVDADGDGFSTLDAVTPDCDDGDATINPDATETAGDEVDQDCDGAELCYVDADEDGYRSDNTPTMESPDVSCRGPGEATETEPTGDCDDTRADLSPAMIEICDDFDDDEDCDYLSDDGDDDTIGQTLWYADRDDDGYGDNFTSELRCDPRESYIADNQDCNDEDASIGPPMSWAPDTDSDGWGSEDPSTWVLACFQPVGYTSEALARDCRDDDSAYHPEAADACMDGYNQDCTGDPDDHAWSWWGTYNVDGGHADEVGGSNPIYVIDADLDGDSDRDLVVAADWSGRVYAFINDGSGGFTLTATRSIGLDARSLAAGLIVSSRRDSIVAVSAGDGTAAVLSYSGSELEILGSVTDLVGGNPMAVALLDTDGDGMDDVAAIGDNNDCTVYYYNIGESGVLSLNTSQQMGDACDRATTGPKQFELATIGGYDWIFSANGNMHSISAIWSNGIDTVLSGTWTASILGLTSAEPGYASVTVGQFDSDTDAEVAAVGLLDGTLLIVNASPPILSSGVVIDLGASSSPEGVVSDDYNEDGLEDLAVALEATDLVDLYVRTGDLSFARRASLTVGDSPREISSADFDSDGDIDLAVVNFHDSTLTLLENNCVP